MNQSNGQPSSCKIPTDLRLPPELILGVGRYSTCRVTSHQPSCKFEGTHWGLNAYEHQHGISAHAIADQGGIYGYRDPAHSNRNVSIGIWSPAEYGALRDGC